MTEQTETRCHEASCLGLEGHAGPHYGTINISSTTFEIKEIQGFSWWRTMRWAKKMVNQGYAVKIYRARRLIAEAWREGGA